ncbi:hypothetical protein LC607_09200 [Nostoc sp. CHAB 5824]|nr:hypothetical protein [Nostoc sp. CHAB 5824]
MNFWLGNYLSAYFIYLIIAIFLPILFLKVKIQRFLQSDWKKSLDKFGKAALEDVLKGYFALMIKSGEASRYMAETLFSSSQLT